MTLIHRPGDLSGFDGSDLQTSPFADPQPLAPLFDGAAFGAAAAAARTVAPTPSTALFLTEAGDSAAISVNDLHQGQMGDCFLISSIGEIALTKPAAIGNMIHVNANGTETVTLYTASNGRLPGFGTTAFKPDPITVTNVFPTNSVNNAASQDVVGGVKEIWPQVIEKAFATLNGGYGGITNGGNPAIAMEELTGRAATPNAPSLSLASLQADVTAGDLITFDTPGRSGLPYNLVGSHAYMFEKVTGTGANAMVTLGNPWGFNQPQPIPFSQVSKIFAEIDVGHA